MRNVPTLLLFLAFPVGLIAYTLAVMVIEAMFPPTETRNLIALFVPLFVAGLAMIPLLIPFFDRKAREDLATITRMKAEQPRPADTGDPPSPTDPRETPSS
jgi:hypothetical protein